MKRLSLLVVVFLSLLGFAGYALAQQAQERAEAPVYRNGDWWEFKVTHRDYFTSSTARLGEGIYKLAQDAGKFKMFDSDGNVVTGYIVSTGTLATMTGSSRRFLDFPLFVGKKWGFDYVTKLGGTPSGGSGPLTSGMNAEVNVVGIEQVTVPAGTFEVFKIERDDRGRVGWHWKWVYYYSPQIKSIVKFLFDSSPEGVAGKTEVELIKFGSSTPAAAK